MLFLVTNGCYRIPNPDWTDANQEISHCALIREYLTNTWPEWDPAYEEEEEEEEEGEEGEEEEEEED